MGDLTNLLGHSSIVADLVVRLARPNSRAWIKGPSGSGRSTIGEQVMATIGQSRPTIFISGNEGHGGTRYLALRKALKERRVAKVLRDALKSGALASLHAIPLVGPSVAELVKIAVAAQGSTLPDFLTSEQQDLLQGLQGVAAGFPLLIVIDNIEWLDAETAQLVLNFQLPEIQAAYSFTNSASILFIENTDSEATLDEDLLQRLQPSDPIHIARVTREIFPLVLKEFGLQSPISAENVSAIYGITQGHLEIAKQIAKTFDCDKDTGELGKENINSIMRTILSKRIAGSKCADDVKRLLCLAACVGTAFSEAEIRCAYRDNQTFSVVLDIALHQQFIQAVDTGLEFSHDVVRSAAEELGSSRSKKMHEKLSECIKLLRPGDYATRLRHARLSGNGNLVPELAFAVSLQAARGECHLINFPQQDIGALRHILDDACTAYQLMDEGDHRGAISKMMRHYTGELSLVQGEVVVLIALNQIKCRNQDAYHAAAALLEHWQAHREEPEIWQRLMSVLIGVWAACGDTDKATQLYARLAESLARQSLGDPTARTRLEALHRKADQFFTTEIATKHIQRAVEWFGPVEGSDVPRNAFEYTASLVNLSAAQFTVGKFEEAANTASSALVWIDTLRRRGLRTTESYKALNNHIIAAFRASTETAEAAFDALNTLLLSTEAGWRLDRSLVAINQGAFMLLAGRTESARKLLEDVLAHIAAEELDDYYALYAASNLAIAFALSNERKRAKDLLEGARQYLDAIPKWFRTAHKRRLELMIGAVEDTNLNSAADFDAFPGRIRAPDGEQDAWWSIGRGLLMSDIQVWSEG